MDVVLVLGMVAAWVGIVNYCTEPVPGFYAARSTVVITGLLLGMIAGLLRRTPDDAVS